MYFFVKSPQGYAAALWTAIYSLEGSNPSSDCFLDSEDLLVLERVPEDVLAELEDDFFVELLAPLLVEGFRPRVLLGFSSA